MAEGGQDFGIYQPGLDHNLDNYGYADGKEPEVDTTRPFQPDAASTLYHGGEEIEMQTRLHEQTGLPETSFEENAPLLPIFGRRPGSLLSELEVIGFSAL